jgi:hypothetical protein
MKTCILCGEDTEGSIGAAGIKWSMICQPCKDKEDQALYHSIAQLSVAVNDILGNMVNKLEEEQ